MFHTTTLVSCPECQKSHDLCVEQDASPAMNDQFEFRCPSTKKDTLVRGIPSAFTVASRRPVDVVMAKATPMPLGS